MHARMCKPTRVDLFMEEWQHVLPISLDSKRFLKACIIYETCMSTTWTHQFACLSTQLTRYEGTGIMLCHAVGRSRDLGTPIS